MKIKVMNFVALVFILICLAGWIKAPLPLAEDGMVDIKKWDFDKNGMITLNGEWNFYWETMDPHNLSGHQPTIQMVPSVWNDKKQYPSSGYGLYHLKMDGLQKGRSYAFKIPTLSNSYRFWIDDQLMLTNGSPGTTKKTTIPFYKPKEVFFTAKNESVDLYIAISNFHYRSGGMWESLTLGTPEQIISQTKRNLAFESMLIGSLILSGLYHIVLYIHRKKERILLLFGIINLVISFRTLVIGEQVIIQFFERIPWELIVKTEYLTFYTVVPLFTWFLHYLYKEEVSRKYAKYLSIISLLFSLLVLFSPAIIYTRSLFLYQAITIVTLVYLISSLFKAVYRKREGSLVVALCAAFYALTVINDILFINGTIVSMNLSSFGLFIFIFSQCYILASRVTNAFQKVEEYSDELSKLNQTLEEKIYERTKSLEISKQELQRVNAALTEISYQDQLTQLPNRRYFENVYETEWEKAIQNQNMLAILYFDIDHFKSYNDAYGHQEGDITLKQVAACLQKTILNYNGIVARIGGEEFIALITNRNTEQMNQIAEECRNEVKRLEIPHKDSLTYPFVTISIGVAATLPDAHSSARNLIRLADEALYFAKEEGRNLVMMSDSY
ncbi:MAG TPA: diguanylate cyclase [Pseudoneobacillus sp.]|nr:diguanylate cyclase [Pseudoneobacillus sp.]